MADDVRNVIDGDLKRKLLEADHIIVENVEHLLDIIDNVLEDEE